MFVEIFFYILLAFSELLLGILSRQVRMETLAEIYSDLSKCTSNGVKNCTNGSEHFIDFKIIHILAALLLCIVL